jgi:endo-1,4-beta-D-glucanase Y
MVVLFIEGGGNNKLATIVNCRKGFRTFLEKAGFRGRMPRIEICGGRDNALKDFRTENPKEVAFLLIDSEASVPENFFKKPWQFLKTQGKEKPPAAKEEQCHFMVQCMENWFLADPETLKKYFGNDFQSSALPNIAKSVESVSVQDAQNKLKHASRNCKKTYKKGSSSFDLLSEIQPEKVIQKSRWAERFVMSLKSALVLYCLFLTVSSSLAVTLDKSDATGKKPEVKITSSAPITLEEQKAILAQSWVRYKATFIQADGRVIDFNGNVSTSEGQSYALLRAFWMRDEETFAHVWKWTKDNLQVPRGDKLFSWKWGQKPDNTWGALDQTSATDADQDIVLALLLAHQVWPTGNYLDEAKAVLPQIWDRLTLNTPLGRVLLPGDWPKRGVNFTVNPSYFSPLSYRIFAEIDTEHDWTLLTDSSYEILNRAVAQTQTHLPPDWVQLSMDNDQVELYADPLSTDPKDARSDFGYEAIRCYWRVGLDALMMPLEKRAITFLTVPTMLPRYWAIRQDVPISLTWDGIVRHPALESGAVYGAILPAFYQQPDGRGPGIVRDILARKVIPNLQPGGQWNTQKDYYAQNWLWFGLALDTLYRDPPDFHRGPLLSRLAKLLGFGH